MATPLSKLIRDTRLEQHFSGRDVARAGRFLGIPAGHLVQAVEASA